MSEMVIRGRTWKFGKNVSTDLILPGSIIWGHVRGQEEQRKAMMPNRPGWSMEVQEGDIIVADTNFGCGSSRPAPRALQERLGVAACVGESFSRIFQRNSVNIGFPALICPGIVDAVEEGDEIEVNVDTGLVRNLTQGTEIQGEAYPADSPPGQLLRMGGLRPYLEQWLEDHPEAKEAREARQ
jgi:3-isopropylmalate/(R)-2-methylmalate dehydratase small subunit